MAKKYLSLERLTEYDALLKAEIDEKIDANKITVDDTLSSTSVNPVQNKVIDAEFDAISNAMGALEAAIDEKSNVGHNHDDLYYTEVEINAKLEETKTYTDTAISSITTITNDEIDAICGAVTEGSLLETDVDELMTQLED